MSYAFEKPPITVSKNGVTSVRPSDILRSRVGQEQIRKMAALDLTRPYRERRGRGTAADGGDREPQG
jgi:hypothetical protein